MRRRHCNEHGCVVGTGWVSSGHATMSVAAGQQSAGVGDGSGLWSVGQQSAGAGDGGEFLSVGQQSADGDMGGVGTLLV